MTQALANPRWTPDDLGDLTGLTVVVTGANSGLGLESSKALAAHGAQVIMAGRNPLKLSQAVGSVRGRKPSPIHLDLGDLASVHAAAAEVGRLTSRIDVLLNNAGVMAPPLQRTQDGFESQIGTNHLGHFAWTGLLLPLLHHDSARVVNVASTAHTMGGGLDPDDLNFERRRYSAWPAYGQSKLANLLFTAELDRRAREAGWDLTVAAAHPGYASTNLQFAGPRFAHNPIGRAVTSVGNRLMGQSAEAGAWPQLYAAVMPDVRGNQYYGPDGLRGMRGHPALVGRSGPAKDMQLAQRLWEVSEQLTGAVYQWE